MHSNSSSADTLLAIKSLTVAPKKSSINATGMRTDYSENAAQKNAKQDFRDALKNAEPVAKRKSLDRANEEKNTEKTAENRHSKPADRDVNNSEETPRDEKKATASNDVSRVEKHRSEATDDSQTSSRKVTDSSADNEQSTPEAASESEPLSSQTASSTQTEDTAIKPLTFAEAALASGEPLPYSGEKISDAGVLSQTQQTASATTALSDKAIAASSAAASTTAVLPTTPESALATATTPSTAEATALAPAAALHSQSATALAEQANVALADGVRATSNGETVAMVSGAAETTAAHSLEANSSALGSMAPAVDTSDETTEQLPSSALHAPTNTTTNAVSTNITATASSPSAADAASENNETLTELGKSPKTILEGLSQDGNKAARQESGPLQGFQIIPPAGAVNAAVSATMKQVADATAAKESAAAETTSALNAATLTKATPMDAKWAQTLNTLQELRSSGTEVTQFKLPIALQNREWGSAVADKVLWMASQNLRSAEVHLDPPELGPMQVRIAVNNDQVSVNFISHQATVRDMLDQNAFRLREMFEQGGLNLVDVDVSDRHTQQQGDGSENDSSGFNGGLVDGSILESNTTASSIELVNLVDYYV